MKNIYVIILITFMLALLGRAEEKTMATHNKNCIEDYQKDYKACGFSWGLGENECFKKAFLKFQACFYK
jgi:hypothetical protein